MPWHALNYTVSASITILDNYSGKSRRLRRRSHDGIGGDRTHPEVANRFDEAAIDIVEHKSSDDILIYARDAEGRDFHSETAQHLVGRPFDGLAADDRTY